MTHYKKTAAGIIEEICNSIIHGIGALAAIGAIIYSSIFLSAEKSFIQLFGFYFFLTTLVLMLLTSTLYHSLSFTKARRVFLILDYSAIFLFIAGSYTAFITAILPTLLGLVFMLIIWIAVITGITLRAVFHKKNFPVFIAVYLLLGWFALIIMKFTWQSLNGNTIILLFLGGVCYSFGTIFFSLKKVRFAHTVWHIFVLGGTILHFFALASI